jgi:hypothetical protein
MNGSEPLQPNPNAPVDLSRRLSEKRINRRIDVLQQTLSCYQAKRAELEGIKTRLVDEVLAQPTRAEWLLLGINFSDVERKIAQWDFVIPILARELERLKAKQPEAGPAAG